jgi:nucleotide-binding universal stress UspA family protein
MYRKILVPLDGSQLSQCSLDHVRAIGQGCKVPEIILIRVVEPLSANEISSLAQLRGDQISKLEEENKAEANDYISNMAQRLHNEGLAARAEVLYGRAADKIIDFAAKNDVDLIIMSSHGRSGISRWAMGSVTDRVVNHSLAPVLVVSSPGCRIAQG